MEDHLYRNELHKVDSWWQVRRDTWCAMQCATCKYALGNKKLNSGNLFSFLLLFFFFEFF